MKSAVLLMATALFLQGQTDLYPQVHELVLEAERISADMHRFKDNGDPHESAADILAHAGYVEDAEKAYAKSDRRSSETPYYLWRAWVIYGRRDRAEKLLELARPAESQARFLASFADLLWRMGESNDARKRFEAARAIAMNVADPTRRKQIVAEIDQGLRFASDPPPDLVSAMPHPRRPFRVQDSPIPLFPITADGFIEMDSKEAAARANENGELIKELYRRAAAGDRDGIERITEGAKRPFQKALGIASLEHILIQQRRPDLAEEYAMRISESDSSSSLAKAEALSAAAQAWLRNSNDNHARLDFDSAKKIVLSVADLPFGKISVLVAIATAQYEGRMVEDSAETFKSAITLAQKLPPRPRVVAGIRRPATPIGVHYIDEGFGKVLRAAVHSGDPKIVDEAAEAWSRTSDDVASEVASAWLAEGHIKEAIEATRKIKDPERRVSELLSIARNQLSEAGAPVF